MNSFFYFLRKARSFQIKFMVLLFFTHINLLLVLGIEFSAFAQPHSRGGAGDTQNSAITLTLTEDDHKVFDKIMGVTLQPPGEIQLNGNEVDLSSITQQLKRAEDSLYETSVDLRDIKNDLLNYPIRRLCDKSTDPKECFNKASNELERTVDTINQNKAGRILYPSGYRRLENGVNDKKMANVSDLDSECVKICSSRYLSDVLTGGSQAQYQMLYDKIKNKSEQCQKVLLGRVADELERKPFPESCRKAENKKHPVCKNMIEDVQIIQTRISELIGLAYEPKPSGNTEANAPCLNCALNVEETGVNNSLKKFIESERDSLSLITRFPKEKEARREKAIKRLIGNRDILVDAKNDAEEKGTLDITLREEQLNGIEEKLNYIEKSLNTVTERIQDYEERLEVVQGWPDSVHTNAD